MKKKFVFLNQLKSKIKSLFQFKKKNMASEIEDDESGEEYELEDNSEDDQAYDLSEDSEVGQEDNAGEDEEDEEFIAQPMTISSEEKVNSERTQEMKRPSFQQLESLSDDDEDEDGESEASPSSHFTDEHSSLTDYKQFELPKKSSFPKYGKLSAFIAKCKTLFAKQSIAINARGELSKLAQKVNLRRQKSAEQPLTWDDLVASLFRVDARPKVHRFFLICLVAIGTYALGKIVATVLEGQSASQMVSRPAPIIQILPDNSLKDLQTIANSDLFNTRVQDEGPKIIVEKKPTVDDNMVCLSAQKASTLPITIKHTTVLQDSVKSIASVQIRGQKDVQDIREGQKINNLAEIGRIDRQKVIVKNLSSGACEFIQMEEEKTRARQTPPIQVVSEARGKQIMKDAEPKGIKNDGNKFVIEKTLRNKMLENISEVLTQARAVQIQNPDGSLAFKMTEIVPGSVYSQLNIQDGDIIEGINGEKINDLNAVMSMFGRIREIDNLSLTIKRDGTTRNFDYNFQ